MRLLDRTVRILLVYAIVILLISIPVFYFIIEYLYYQDVDDVLRLKKKELMIRVKKLENQHDINLWLGMDQEVKLKPLKSKATIRDTIYPKLYFDTLDHEMEPYRELRTALNIGGKNYLTTIRRSLVESEDLITGIAEAQAVLLILLFGGWILINRQLSRKIWDPFEQIIDWLKFYEMGKDPGRNFPLSGITEFDTLNEAVTNLIEKNHGIFVQQKNFIENASHEMQTPVAILQSKLDLLVVSEELTADQARHLQSMYETIERLNHLNKSLLLLSQIENNQFDEVSLISVGDIVTKIIGHIEEIAKGKDIHIYTEIEADVLFKGNAVLMEIALSNLLTNAVTHTPFGGEINIGLNQSVLIFRNSGKPLKFDQAILFRRFGKDKTSKYGVGLGLAIVKQITELMEISVSYTYASNKHQFTIDFDPSEQQLPG